MELLSQSKTTILLVISGCQPFGIYGVDIQSAAIECSEGTMTIPTGTLYATLKKLKEEGYITCTSQVSEGSAKRHYCNLTELGEAQVKWTVDYLNKLQWWRPAPQPPATDDDEQPAADAAVAASEEE